MSGEDQPSPAPRHISMSEKPDANSDQGTPGADPPNPVAEQTEAQRRIPQPVERIVITELQEIKSRLDRIGILQAAAVYLIATIAAAAVYTAVKQLAKNLPEVPTPEVPS